MFFLVSGKNYGIISLTDISPTFLEMLFSVCLTFLFNFPCLITPFYIFYNFAFVLYILGDFLLSHLIFLYCIDVILRQQNACYKIPFCPHKC